MEFANKNWNAVPDLFADALDVKIQQALSVESFQSIFDTDILQSLPAKLIQRFVLGWMHYVTLLTVKNAAERHFYELEAAENGWG